MIAIIPARGGSKGLHGKNIKNLNGKPLIAYTIETALKAKYVDKVIVSTDDKKIADVSIEYGAEVPFLRPLSLASDDALAVDTYIYTINRLKKDLNISTENFVVLQPTSPLRTEEDIDSAIDLFYKKNADSVISYMEETHPVYWHKIIREDFSFIDIFDEKLTNRQELKKTFYPNGAIFVFKTTLIKQRKYYSANSYAYIMPRERSVDIDTIDDFEYAEFLLNKRLTERNES